MPFPATVTRTKTWLVALLGLVIVLFYTRDFLAYCLNGRNDYLQLYAGARMVETKLYIPGDAFAIQMQAAGFYGEALEYVRPPFYAVLLWPLGRLPYLESYLVWQAFSVTALIGFILAWQVTNKQITLLACCWSLPLLLGLAHGQDLTFLLLLLAISLRSHNSRPFVAGALLSLCAIKFNLFFPLPLLIATQRRWRMLGGLVTGCAVLTAVSFAFADAGWPMRYFKILTQGNIAPEEQIMPNFHAMLLGVPHRQSTEIALGIVTALALVFVARRTDFFGGLAAMIVGGLLVSHHAYPQDCTLLIPSLLIVMARSSDWWLNYLCVALFTPWPYLNLIQGDPLNLTRWAIAALLIGMMIQSHTARSTLRQSTENG